ncbi:MAG TPA: tyrosine--tRNA ligase, partial [Candidatus Saccharimonadales bacterium]
EAHVYSTPLVINKATGKKFGKSEDGAVWLDPKKTSVYKFYQFWLNVDDEGVIDYAKIYTLLSKEELEALGERHAANPGIREAQKTLAREVTTLVHGTERTESVMRVTDVLFGAREFSELNDDDLETLAGEIPTVGTGKTVIESLVEAGVAGSNGEARRLIAGGAVSLNGEKVNDDSQVTKTTLIKKGKNNFVLIK